MTQNYLVPIVKLSGRRSFNAAISGASLPKVTALLSRAEGYRALLREGMFIGIAVGKLAGSTLVSSAIIIVNEEASVHTKPRSAISDALGNYVIGYQQVRLTTVGSILNIPRIQQTPPLPRFY